MHIFRAQISPHVAAALNARRRSATVYKTSASEIVAGIPPAYVNVDGGGGRHHLEETSAEYLLVRVRLVWSSCRCAVSYTRRSVDVCRKFLIVVESLTSLFASHAVLRKHFSSPAHHHVSSCIVGDCDVVIITLIRLKCERVKLSVKHITTTTTIRTRHRRVQACAH